MVDRWLSIDWEGGFCTLPVVKAQWEAEKDAIHSLRTVAEKTEKARQDQAAAERQGDLNRAAELKYGVLPSLEKEQKEQKQTR